MKKYAVEFKKLSWMVVEVEAASEEDAEEKGYQYLEAEGILKDACWGIESVWEKSDET